MGLFGWWVKSHVLALSPVGPVVKTGVDLAIWCKPEKRVIKLIKHSSQKSTKVNKAIDDAPPTGWHKHKRVEFPSCDSSDMMPQRQIPSNAIVILKILKCVGGMPFNFTLSRENGVVFHRCWIMVLWTIAVQGVVTATPIISLYAVLGSNNITLSMLRYCNLKFSRSKFYSLKNPFIK